MVAPVITDRKRQQLFQEVQLARQRQNVALARTNGPAARRILEAYKGSLPAIQALLNDALASGDKIAINRIGLLVQDIAQELNSLEKAVNLEAAALERAGIQAGVQTGISNLQAGGMGVRFGVVTLDTIQSGINIVESAAFQKRLGMLADYHAQQISDLIHTGIAMGRNPREIAALATRYFTQSQRPAQDALRLARTTQIYASRYGTQQTYMKAGIEFWIWSANLGNPRTCKGCISLHGSRWAVKQVLNDHHNGRCAMVPVTPTWEELGLFGTGELSIEDGAAWMSRQDEQTQRSILGPELFEAWQRGAFEYNWQTVTTEYDNDIFGKMRRPKSNQDILGNSN